MSIPMSETITTKTEPENCFHGASKGKFIDWSDPTMRAKLLDGRKNRTPRSVFDKAIACHCAECWPYQSDCTGHECHLYEFRNHQARKGKTKTATRRAIRLECKECVGTPEDICQSPNCGLYSVRFGRNPEQPALSPLQLGRLQWLMVKQCRKCGKG